MNVWTESRRLGQKMEYVALCWWLAVAQQLNITSFYLIFFCVHKFLLTNWICCSVCFEQITKIWWTHRQNDSMTWDFMAFFRANLHIAVFICHIKLPHIMAQCLTKIRPFNRDCIGVHHVVQCAHFGCCPWFFSQIISIKRTNNIKQF